MRQKTLSATALSVTEPCSRGRTRRGRARHGIGPDDRVFSNPTSEVYAGGVDSGVVPVPTGEHVPVMVADVTSPRIAYAISRLLGRAAFVHAAGAKAVGAVIGRFHNGYGPRMGADHVIPEMSLRTLCGEDPLRVWGADQYRAFCYVDDAAEAMLRLMDRSGAAGEIVHIGNGSEQTNIGDLAKLVLRLAGVSPAVRTMPAPAGSVTRRCPDLSKLRRWTAFEPTAALDEGVRRTFKWFRQVHG